MSEAGSSRGLRMARLRVRAEIAHLQQKLMDAERQLAPQSRRCEAYRSALSEAEARLRRAPAEGSTLAPDQLAGAVSFLQEQHALVEHAEQKLQTMKQAVASLRDAMTRLRHRDRKLHEKYSESRKTEQRDLENWLDRKAVDELTCFRTAHDR